MTPARLAPAAGPEPPPLTEGQMRTGSQRLLDAVRGVRRLREGGLLVTVLLIGIAFTIANSTFADVNNLTNIASQVSFLGVLAVSSTFVLITGEIDLSIGSMVAVCAVVFGLVMQAYPNVWVAGVITLGAGTVLGAVNGLLSLVLRVPAIIVTLGMLNAYRGLADQMANGYPLENYPKSSAFFTVLGQGSFAHVPYNAIVLVIFAILSGLFLRRTTGGVHIYAMGSDRRCAALAGIMINRIKVGVLMFSGFAAAISALLAVAQTTSADPNLGTGYELSALAAVIIGGANLNGGSGTVLASVLGMVLIGMIQNGLVIVGVPIYLLVVVSGLVVIVAVAIDRFFGRRRFSSAGT
jgi:ribose/xylose/arabinose/galactoside ABC-type transport system permease subunit